MNVKQSVR